MSLDKKIERTRKKLNAAVLTKSLVDKDIIDLSQKLDDLIVERMRRDLA